MFKFLFRYGEDGLPICDAFVVGIGGECDGWYSVYSWTHLAQVDLQVVK